MLISCALVDQKIVEARLELDGKLEELEEQKEIEAHINPDFDFNKYTFYDHSTMYKLKYITEEYVKQGKLNTKKIRKLIVHSIYEQVQK